MDSSDLTRRSFLVAAAASGTAAFAGCLGDDDEEYYEGEEFVDEEPDYGGYLSDVSYPGTVDWTGENEGRVFVGTGREGMGYAPRSVRIEAGATVVWEWTGDGGRHDVVDADGAFESDETAEAGHTYEHTFEEAGTHTYFCTPHEHRGMRGGVEVV